MILTQLCQMMTHALPPRAASPRMTAQARSLLKMADIAMLTISVFLLTAGSVLTSVWWACKNEDVSSVVPPSDTAPA